MALKLVQGKRTAQVFSCPLDGSTAVTRGAMLYVDESVGTGGVVRLATGAAEATELVQFVANQTVASGATTILATLIEPGQVWAIDTLNTEAATHNFKHHLMSTSLLLNNTVNTVSTHHALWLQIDFIGATTDNKALCIPAVCGQTVTATA